MPKKLEPTGLHIPEKHLQEMTGTLYKDQAFKATCLGYAFNVSRPYERDDLAISSRAMDIHVDTIVAYTALVKRYSTCNAPWQPYSMGIFKHKYRKKKSLPPPMSIDEVANSLIEPFDPEEPTRYDLLEPALENINYFREPPHRKWIMLQVLQGYSNQEIYRRLPQELGITEKEATIRKIKERGIQALHDYFLNRAID